MLQRMIYATILLVLLPKYGECQKTKGKCTIGMGFQGKFAVKEPATGNKLGSITIDSTKLTVTYKNKNYDYVCRAVGDRPDVLLFRTSDASKPSKVLCLQFIHIADHPFASLVLRRYSKFSPSDNDFFTPLDKSTPDALTCALPDPNKPVEGTKRQVFCYSRSGSLMRFIKECYNNSTIFTSSPKTGLYTVFGPIC